MAWLLRGPARNFRALARYSHSDFQKVTKGAPGTAAKRIVEQLDSSKVVLYMKGSPSAPACGFSWKTVEVLDAMGVPYKAYNILEDDEIRQGIKMHSSWPTIPQLYVAGEFIGGCDIVLSMAKNGELRETFENAGAYSENSD